MSTISQASPDFVTSGYALVSQGARYDAEGRQAWRVVYEGTQDGIDALRATFPGSGVDVDSEFLPGGRSRLTAVYGYYPGSGGGPGSEVPQEQWSYEEISTQPSLWTHPTVAPVISKAGGSALKKQLEDAIRAGEPNPWGTATSGDLSVMRDVYDRFLRGVESWEASRPVIRRVRSFTVQYAPRTTLLITSQVYSRSSLISSFSPPSAFQAQIPVDPTWDPPTVQSQWGWKKGPQSSGYNKATRLYEEVLTWEGAFWDTALYIFL